MTFINKFTVFFSKRSTGNILAILVILIMLILGLSRLYPFNNHFNSILNDTGNDWLSYAQMGLDIKHNGLLIPMIKTSYYGPAGFLYNYFVALCIFIFGANDVPIFIIQILMMGLSIALIYWTFRDKMRYSTAVMFLGALSIFAILDVYKHYAFRLLSENLTVFMVSLFFFCFIRGFEKDRLGLQILSAFLLGLLTLIRPNMLVFAILLIFIAILPFYLKRENKRTIRLLLFVFVLFITASLLALRNYLVCGEWIFFPTVGSFSVVARYSNPIPESVDLSKITANFLFVKMHIDKEIVAYVEYVRQKPLAFFFVYLKHALFCFGFLSIIVPSFRYRIHWMFMWLGYFMYLFLCIKDHKKIQMWEIGVQLYIFSYYGTTILMSNMGSYGFRYLIPATYFVLIFSFLLFDRLRQKRFVSIC